MATHVIDGSHAGYLIVTEVEGGLEFCAMDFDAAAATLPKPQVQELVEALRAWLSKEE